MANARVRWEVVQLTDESGEPWGYGVLEKRLYRGDERVVRRFETLQFARVWVQLLTEEYERLCNEPEKGKRAKAKA